MLFAALLLLVLRQCFAGILTDFLVLSRETFAHLFCHSLARVLLHFVSYVSFYAVERLPCSKPIVPFPDNLKRSPDEKMSKLSSQTRGHSSLEDNVASNRKSVETRLRTRELKGVARAERRV